MIEKMTSYCNTVVLNHAKTHVLILTKNRGPQFLIGKDNFPGGHIENGENPVDAAVREVHEETGIALDAKDMTLLHHHVSDESELMTYVAFVSHDVLMSYESLTDEPVKVEALSHYMPRLILDTSIAVPDVSMLITAALKLQPAMANSPTP